jgi:hypothetical protein
MRNIGKLRNIMVFNESFMSLRSWLSAKSTASPERIFRLVAAPADDHGINIADVAIGEINSPCFACRGQPGSWRWG